MVEHRDRRRDRRPLPGYPITEKFSSREAIENYLSDDRIICLLCGRPFKAMTMHLSIHGITADEYKDLYNIPYSYGLARETTRRMHSEAFKARLRDDPDLLPRMQKLIADNAEARKKGLMKARPRRDFIMDEYTQRALKNAGHETQFSDADKAAYLDAVSNGMTRNEAIESIGFGKTALYQNFKTDPAFKEMSSRALEAQPFHLQARQQSLGKRFEVECARLLAKGMSDHEIAAKLGVTAMSVNRRTKKMRRQKK